MPGLFRRPPQPQQPRPHVIPAAPAGAAFDFTGTWAQAAATWDASATESFTSTATWDQAAAAWAAVASEAFSATGSFAQAAAAWSAIATETFTSTATWNQAAASWDALANNGDLAFTGSWTQAAATWDATVTVPIAGGGTGGKFGHVVVRRQREPAVITPEPVVLVAAFAQPAASWRAEMDTHDSYDLFLLFDEPALIGAH